jgi:pimeloyl-ACP methyl ester carboxylesterase
MRLILEVCDALDLDKPVAMDCSIGGRIVLHLAHQHPVRFRAPIGLESAPYAEAYYDLTWLNRPDVHGGMVCADVISGLITPTVADAERWETLWH